MKTTIIGFKKYLFVLLFSIAYFNLNAATFVVDNATDIDNLAGYTLADGTNSFRKCMRIANGTAGADIIDFNIPGVGPFTITLGGPDIPAVTQQLTINGLSQPGASAGTLMIEINAAATGNALVFDAGSANSSVTGLCINRSNRGVWIINTSAITMQACYIGTDITGTIARPCNWNGVQVDNAPDVVIGGNADVNTRNIISGNNEVGLRVDNSPRILINGNYFGVNATGNAILANGWHGIQFVNACNNSVIGNGLLGGKNVISGHGRDGALINNSTGVTIKGNHVGLGNDGTTLISNLESGIRLNGGSHNVQIGGSTLLERNIIAGNMQNGIRMEGSTNGFIQGNHIGTDIFGTIDMGNGENGIAVYGLSNTLTVGGFVSGQGNLISGNNQNGVYIENSLAPSFYGNIIGLNVMGTALLSNNQQGISINANSNGPLIGGVTALHRNIVSGNLEAGIRIGQSTSPVIYGNFIGTDITGAVDLGNAQNGIILVNASNNPIIGGAVLGQGNLISGNNQNGLSINDCAAPVIKGNCIGLNLAAAAALANGYNGIYIINSATPAVGGIIATERNIVSGNTESGMIIISSATPTILGNYVGVGITASTDLGNGQQGISLQTLDGAIIGNGTLAGTNIVSGNNFNGISFNAVTNGIIRGNIVGADITGLVDLGNTENGITIFNTSTDPFIGGAVLGQGNLISGNNQAGIVVNGSLRPNIKGNIVGLASDGNAVLANMGPGIAIFNLCNNAIIGGALLTEKNIISGNGQIGIHINGSLSPTIFGNHIGTDITGLLDRGNGETGILINAGSTNALIGSAVAGTGNIISGNGQAGLFILNSDNPSVKANIVGLGIDGTTAIGNTQGGITNENSNTPVIGGTTIQERNLVSSNGESGVFIINSINAIIKANYIGVNVTGMLARGNGQAGIRVINNSNGAIIGGPSLVEGNICSNNSWAGILVNSSTDVVVKSNIIGLASDRSTSSPNLQNGISVFGSCHRMIIGGVLPTERNYVSSNTGDGININGSDDVSVVNNYVGVEVTGLLARPNTGNGVNFDLSNRAIIGGASYFARNIISSNGANGLRIFNESNDAIVKANIIGLGVDGVSSLGNVDNGLYIADSSNQAIIGGSTFVERNILSGNGTSGIGDGLRSLECSRHIILGNYCGVDSTGTIVRGNAWAGISLNETVYTTTGGPGAFDGNICSGNLNEGVYFRNAVHITFIGNYVGTDKTGTLALGNEDYGVNIRALSINNIVGGSLANANTIAYNRNVAGPGPGVFVEGGSQFNTITYNKIYCNAGLGIELNGAANESIARPVLSTSTANQVTGTGAIDGDIIHVYINNTTGTGCDCEGELFIGTAVVAGGVWVLNHNLGYSTTQAESLSATETTALGSTSQFADCIIPLPVLLLSFKAQKLNEHAAVLTWQTSSEKNNHYFQIERSIDGINFEVIGVVQGAGNSSSLLSYSFIDENPYVGVNYYRLNQVDFDLRAEHSVIKSVDFGDSKIGLSKENDSYFILSNFEQQTEIHYSVYASDGKLVVSETYQATRFKKEINLSGLSTAVYFIKVNAGEVVISEKIMVR